MTAPLTDVLAALLVDIREAAHEVHADEALCACLETVVRRHTALSKRLADVTAQYTEVARELGRTRTDLATVTTQRDAACARLTELAEIAEEVARREGLARNGGTP